MIERDRLLTLSTARTTLERPACTATVEMVVVEGGKSVTSLDPDIAPLLYPASREKSQIESHTHL